MSDEVSDTARCGASWAASTAIRAPRACATPASSATGQISPVTLDAPVTVTSTGPSAARAASASSSCARGLSRIGWHREKHRAGPRQQVGVMLAVPADHGRVRRQRPGQQVQRVRGVPGEDDMIVWPSVEEVRDRFPRLLVLARTSPGRRARATVHAGVPRQQLVHRLGDDGQARSGRGVVQVGVRHGPAVRERNQQITAEYRGPAGGAAGPETHVGNSGHESSTYCERGLSAASWRRGIALAV